MGDLDCWLFVGLDLLVECGRFVRDLGAMDANGGEILAHDGLDGDFGGKVLGFMPFVESLFAGAQERAFCLDFQCRGLQVEGVLARQASGCS